MGIATDLHVVMCKHHDSEIPEQQDAHGSSPSVHRALRPIHIAFWHNKLPFTHVTSIEVHTQ